MHEHIGQDGPWLCAEFTDGGRKLGIAQQRTEVLSEEHKTYLHHGNQYENSNIDVDPFFGRLCRQYMIMINPKIMPPKWA